MATYIVYPATSNLRGSNQIGALIVDAASGPAAVTAAVALAETTPTPGGVGDVANWTAAVLAAPLVIVGRVPGLGDAGYPGA